MAKDNTNSFNDSSSLTKEPDSNKSFVKKVRSRVSGLLPSSLSKWFRNDDSKAVVRQREEDDDDDEYYDIQPPSKRVKIPNDIYTNSVSATSFASNDIRNHSINAEDRQHNIRSSFLEPLPGPSGLQSRKTFTPTLSVDYNSTENLLNGDKDSDSDESTSGYSSMARKDLASSMESKKADELSPNIKPTSLFNSSSFGGHSRSLFIERSVSPQVNSSLSSRRPSFNASTFGSPNFIDRTLSTKRIINSPFYSGRTMYGGASAYSFQQGKSPNDKRLARQNQIQVKPINQSTASDNPTLSKTARRILNALEEYTTPVSDAKKIPNPLQKRARPEGLLSKYTGANPYLMREKSSSSNRELQIPTVPDLLKMKLKERLQDSTVAVRQIATTSKSALNAGEYKIRAVDEEPPKHTNKMKSKVTATRQKQDKQDSQVVEEVKLPDIALPITSLPKFDFSLPLPPSCSKPLVTVVCNDPPKLPETSKPKVCEQVTQKQNENCIVQVKSNTTDTIEYKFSNPLVLAENLVSIIAINDFKFSDPVFKQKDKTVEATSTIPKSPTSNFKLDSGSLNSIKLPEVSLNFKSSDSSNIILKKKSQNMEVGQPAAKLVSGSIEEVFSKTDKTVVPLSSLDKFKPDSTMWECSTCLIRNLPGKLKCTACETPKPKNELISKKQEMPTELPKPIGFGNQFKMSTDKWECGACMVRNSNADYKCVACTTPKPVQNKPNGPITSMPAPVVSTFGDKFKPPSSTWECPVCMIRNKEDVRKCAACEASKPGTAKKLSLGGFGDSFKKKSNEWECTICMVRNSNDKTTCVACETAKPGTTSTKVSLPKEKEKISSFNFGIFPSNTGVQEIKTEVTQSKNSSNSIGAIFGNTTNTSTTASVVTPTFTFGIPAKATTTAANDIVTTTVKPKDAVSETSFKPPEKSQEKPIPVPTGFVFGTTSNASKPATTSDKLPAVTASLPKLEEIPKLTEVVSGGFTFGTTSQPINPPEVPSSILPLPQKPKETVIEKPVQVVPSTGTFTFVASAPSLKRSAADAETSNSKRDAPAPTSLMFSPPKQQFRPNTADSSLVNKPLPLNGNVKLPETNLFGSLTKSVTPSQITTSSTFTFGGTPSQAPSVLPTTSAPSNLFSFAAKTTTPSLFGNTTTTTEAPVFKFNVGQPEQPSSQSGFGINTNMQPAASNVFGANSTTSVFASTSKPVFEAPAAAPAPAAAFGSVPPLGFGTSTGISEIKPFTFGPPANEEAPPNKTPAFSFGQATKLAEPPKAPSGFSFGNAAPPPSAPSGGFSFNPNPNPAPSINFNFNTPKVENPSPFQSPAPAAPSIFGTPVVASQPQPVQNGGFNFGGAGSNSTVKTGFNFGATPQFNAPPAPAPNTGVFNFGTSNPTPAPPVAGGFNFGATSTPAFNANVKPTFNFTGGATPTFSAQPAPDSSMVAQRKKIRAVRRNQR